MLISNEKLLIHAQIKLFNTKFDWEKKKFYSKTYMQK